MTQDLLIVLAVGAFLLAGLMLWALFLRKRPHAHPKPGRRSVRALEETDEADGTEAREPGQHKHRRRRRRRDHRSRNPTLAETGGLPPPRSQSSLPPAT